MIKFDFKDKNVIVTGAGMGLGKKVAECFAKAGANVIIADMNMDAAMSTAKELREFGTKVYAYKIDVSNYSEFEGLKNYVLERLDSVDILINNAGICTMGNLEDMDVNLIDKMLKVNINGTVYGCKTFLPLMKERKYGKVVNFSSIAAKLGTAGASIYSTTKAGVLELTTCLAREYAKDNININCVLPGIIRTPLWEQMLVDFTKENHADKDAVFKSFTDGIPTGRPQDEIDIANAVLFLCTDESYNITAQNLGVDGGQTY